MTKNYCDKFGHKCECGTYFADIERERDEARAEAADMRKTYEEEVSRCVRAEADAARLREALKRIANGYDDGVGPCYWSGLDARDIARAALAGEEGT